jgi:hypothetical protein
MNKIKPNVQLPSLLILLILQNLYERTLYQMAHAIFKPRV